MLFSINTKKIIALIIIGFVSCTVNSNNTIAKAYTSDTYITNIVVPPAIDKVYTPIDIEPKNTHSEVYVRLSSSTYGLSTQVWGLYATIEMLE